jgi:hypothetical protein
MRRFKRHAALGPAATPPTITIRFPIMYSTFYIEIFLQQRINNLSFYDFQKHEAVLNI